MPLWGRLANEGFEDQPLKAVYFFAGNWKSGSDPIWSDQKYDEATLRNDQNYTIFPEDDRHLLWSQDSANRDFALDEILGVGANVVVMSSWGATGSHRWAWSAPMQTAPKSHDELFEAAIGRRLLIMPAIESAAGTPEGTSPAYIFSDDFPGTPESPAPGLVEQVVDLINRYLLYPRNPQWPALWVQMYDNVGLPRFAINILHVASRHLNQNANAEFAAGFDAVANRVLQLTGFLVGFTLDMLPSPHPYQIGDARGWVPWFNPGENVRINPGSPITQSWANQDHLDLYAIDEQGIVVSTWWDKAELRGYRPEGWYPVHRETLFQPGALVTAIRRIEDHVDLFATDIDGVVRTIWWDKNEPEGYRPEGWLEIHSETRCPKGASVAAAWVNEDHLDLFVTDQYGVVNSTYWDANDTNGYRAEGWFAIDAATRFQPGGHVTALHRNEDHLDLFAADLDGVVRSIEWDSNGGYRAEGWFAIDAGKRTTPGAKITALWAGIKHLDLFVTGDDGVVRSTYWYEREPLGYRSLGWFDINADVRSQPGSPVEALWSHDGTKLHLFMADIDGRVVEAVWPNPDDPSHPWQNWAPIWPHQIRTVPGGAVTASHPRGVHLDAFIVDMSDRPFASWQDDLRDTYVGQPEALGPHLRNQASMLAIQGYVPEIWMGGSNDLARMNKKADYWLRWFLQGIPVMMDINPGYDAHLVFKDSPKYGYTNEWRGWFLALWQPWLNGVVYNAWNGYTEGYAGMRQKVTGDRDFAWLRRMFSLF